MTYDVAALYVRKDSIYKVMDGVEPWDAEKDARKYPGGMPVVAHPPCRTWGKYAYKAKAAPGERELALKALEQVRDWGGVMEHPVGSEIAAYIPGLDQYDWHGGITIKVNQCDWGHKALKPTLLYCVGVNPDIIAKRPEPLSPIKPLENMSKKQREETPFAFAKWLVELARSVN